MIEIFLAIAVGLCCYIIGYKRASNEWEKVSRDILDRWEKSISKKEAD